MKVHFSQVYIQVGVEYPFSFRFQHFLSKRVSERAKPSPEFTAGYGEDFDVVFNISAKAQLVRTEILGPAVFRNDKDVEFTVFLPFNSELEQDLQEVLQLILTSVVDIFQRLKLDITELERDRNAIIEAILMDESMTKPIL